MMQQILSNSEWAKDIGLLVIRAGIGLIFVKHGWDKLMGGTQTWEWLGQQMSFMGITFMPVMWGFLAASAEFLGGISLVAGFYTRLAALLISVVMIVALVMHVNTGDPFKVYSFPMSMLVIFIGLAIAGGGKYTLTR